MAFASHIITVRRLKKYIDDVIGKKANLPNNQKTIIDNISALFDMYHPVGSLYPTTNSSFNPNTATGWHGKWERIKDCVIYASGDSDTVGQIVGSNTHTLTEAELPSHRHTIPSLSGTASGGSHKHSASMPRAFQASGGSGSRTVIPGFPASGSGQYDLAIDVGYSGSLSMSVTTNASTTGTTGSSTAIDMRTRRLNSVVWRRTA